MRMYQDTRRLDFHALGREIKRKREAKGWTQEYLAQLVDRTPRSIMYFENRGQHPSLNTFYQIVTLLDISVDQFFYPDRQNRESDCRQHIDRLLNSIDEKELTIMEATAKGPLSELKSITCLRKIVCMYRSKIGVTVFFVSRLGFLNFHDSGNANLSNSSNCPYQSCTYANSNKSVAIICFLFSCGFLSLLQFLSS